MRPEDNGRVILLSHGDGGKLTHELLQNLFLKHFRSNALSDMADAAVLESKSSRLALTTDAFVVKPLFFPGGDIGKLAVCGTVNDLAVSGAQPWYLTASFILEEGLSLDVLEQVVSSMAKAASRASAAIVAGDTKVVPRGEVDKIFITTTGAGFLGRHIKLGYQEIAVGDCIIVNGPIGEHGMAVMVQRAGFSFQEDLKSDCACLWPVIEKLLARQDITGVKFMRDLTRGGLATGLKEVAVAAGLDFYIREESVPVRETVKGAAGILGLDPFYLANEGRFMAVVSPKRAEEVLSILRNHPLGYGAEVIGEVRKGGGSVVLKTRLGGSKYLELLAGDPLPRIC